MCVLPYVTCLDFSLGYKKPFNLFLKREIVSFLNISLVFGSRKRDVHCSAHWQDFHTSSIVIGVHCVCHTIIHRAHSKPRTGYCESPHAISHCSPLKSSDQTTDMFQSSYPMVLWSTAPQMMQSYNTLFFKKSGSIKSVCKPSACWGQLSTSNMQLPHWKWTIIAIHSSLNFRSLANVDWDFF